MALRSPIARVQSMCTTGLVSQVVRSSAWRCQPQTAILFGQPHAVPEAHRLVEITEEQFRPCVGTYRSDEGRVFQVSWDEMPVVERTTHSIVFCMSSRARGRAW